MSFERFLYVRWKWFKFRIIMYDAVCILSHLSKFLKEFGYCICLSLMYFYNIIGAGN